jgi:hypothetical protein
MDSRQPRRRPALLLIRPRRRVGRRSGGASRLRGRGSQRPAPASARKGLPAVHRADRCSTGRRATGDTGLVHPPIPEPDLAQNRSWVVVSEIDFDSTLVAGSSSLIASVLAEPKIEAWPIELDASLTIDADTINV